MGSNSIDCNALRQKIARRLDDGSLPDAGNQKIFGGYGAHQPCAACEVPVLETDVLYEVEVQTEAEPVVLAMHRSCFDIWMEQSLARRRRDQ
jgi:hypothetical protein